jgi:hypothetical protein
MPVDSLAGILFTPALSTIYLTIPWFARTFWHRRASAAGVRLHKNRQHSQPVTKRQEVSMKALANSFALSVLLCICMIGCATMGDVLNSKDEGTAQTYPVKSDQAWEMAMTVLRWEGCETIEEHRSSGYMLSTVGQNFVSAGTLVGVWVESINKGNTKVTIVTKRKVQTSLATGLTEATFQRRFAQAVALVKKGKKLPVEPPPDTGD